MQEAAWEMGRGQYSYVSKDGISKFTVAVKMLKVVSKIAQIAQLSRLD